MALDTKAAEAAVKEQQTEVLEAASLPPQAPAVRNINYDVHQGPAAQRPYAHLEDRMGVLQRGYASYEDMAAAEKKALGDKATMTKQDDGSWVRFVVEAAGGDPVIRDGKAYHVKRRVPRPVALSLSDAKQAPADYFDGGSWIRDGRKREGERFDPNASRGAGVEEFLEPASAQDQAAIRTEQQRRFAATPQLPDAPSNLKVQDSTGPSPKKEG